MLVVLHTTLGGDEILAVVLRTGQIGGLLRACHPLPVATVTVLVGALAAAWGRGPAGTALVVAAVLTGQLSVGWANDVLDRDRDRTVGRPDKPVATGLVSPALVTAAAATALALCVPLSLANGLLAGTVHLLGVAAAWGYDLRLKATAWSWLPYAVGFAALPAFVVLSLPGSRAPAWWVVAAGALLGVGAHAANVLPDLADDARTGVRGLPHRLGATGTRVLAIGTLAGAATLLVLAPPGSPSGWALVGLIGVLATAAIGLYPGLDSRDRTPFHAVLAAAAVAVAVLVALPAPVA